MQKDSKVRPESPAEYLPTQGLLPLPVSEEAVPAVGDLSAGDGASRTFRPAPKTSGYSTNVPMPDNTGPTADPMGTSLGSAHGK